MSTSPSRGQALLTDDELHVRALQEHLDGGPGDESRAEEQDLLLLREEADGLCRAPLVDILLQPLVRVQELRVGDDARPVERLVDGVVNDRLAVCVVDCALDVRQELGAEVRRRVGGWRQLSRGTKKQRAL